MVIGEAPGKNEVLEGRPFVGDSGQLLRRALQEEGIDPGDCYLTNVVKFHPQDAWGKTRPPTLNECSDQFRDLYLEASEVRPVKTLLLGRTAQNWYPEGICGKIVKAWHPSYVLRKGGYGSETYKIWLEQLRPFL